MILDFSDTTLRTRRDEWIAAGVFDDEKRSTRSIASSVSTSRRSTALNTKRPTAAKGPVPRLTGANSESIGVDRHGVPIGWALDGANRNDVKLLDPTLDAAHGLLADVDTIHLDRGYDHNSIRRRMIERDLLDVDIQPRRKPGHGKRKKLVSLGLHRRGRQLMAVELRVRRNTDRRTHHRHAALCLATTILIGNSSPYSRVCLLRPSLPCPWATHRLRLPATRLSLTRATVQSFQRRRFNRRRRATVGAGVGLSARGRSCRTASSRSSTVRTWVRMFQVRGRALRELSSSTCGSVTACPPSCTSRRSTLLLCARTLDGGWNGSCRCRLSRCLRLRVLAD